MEKREKGEGEGEDVEEVGGREKGEEDGEGEGEEGE